MSGNIKLDVLAVGAHPDDVELAAGGTIRLLREQGYQVGILDLTRGELGSRGSAEERAAEAAEAADILDVTVRQNLGLPDGHIQNSKANQLRFVEVVRKLRPRIVLIPPLECRHPDHGNAARLCIDAAFYSGLRKVGGSDDDNADDFFRPEYLLHYMQALYFDPDLVVDVSSTWGHRTKAVAAYRSQFHDPSYEAADDAPETYVSEPAFLKSLEGRARMFGHRIGSEFGEGFSVYHGHVAVTDLPAVLSAPRRA